eukprot:jgi/Botrbrau1/5323/Bobra.0391s0033.1
MVVFVRAIRLIICIGEELHSKHLEQEMLGIQDVKPFISSVGVREGYLVSKLILSVHLHAMKTPCSSRAGRKQRERTVGWSRLLYKIPLVPVTC